MSNYSTYYLTDVRLILLTKYNYKKLHDVDVIKRVDISLLVKDSKQAVNSLTALSVLSNRGLISHTSSVGNSNNYRRGNQKNKTEITSSIFGDSVFTFVENLINYYVPRIRYFKGFNPSNFSSAGDIAFTMKDLMIFPELEEELELFYKLTNLKISFISKRKMIARPVFFYSLFGFTFV